MVPLPCACGGTHVCVRARTQFSSAHATTTTRGGRPSMPLPRHAAPPAPQTCCPAHSARARLVPVSSSSRTCTRVHVYACTVHVPRQRPPRKPRHTTPAPPAKRRIHARGWAGRGRGRGRGRAAHVLGAREGAAEGSLEVRDGLVHVVPGPGWLRPNLRQLCIPWRRRGRRRCGRVVPGVWVRTPAARRAGRQVSTCACACAPGKHRASRPPARHGRGAKTPLAVRPLSRGLKTAVTRAEMPKHSRRCWRERMAT